jgi:argininosuccinate lyase
MRSRKRAPAGRRPRASARKRKWAPAAAASDEFLEFASSTAEDEALLRSELVASIAHVTALERARVIERKEASALRDALRDIARKADAGQFELDPSLEDVHMNVEASLTEALGDLGRKVHTGRSRNEQIAVDERLFLRGEVARLVGGAIAIQEALLAHARAGATWIMPGFTHLQHAQPITLGFWALSHVSRFERDSRRLLAVVPEIEVSPLGSGALSGTGYPLDRDLEAELLGFRHPHPNALDAVSDRDHLVHLLSACALFATHLSQLSEDFILFATPALGFVSLGRSTSTGSSMMPQKRNPDAFELARGGAGRVTGALVALLTTLKGLPTGYNRDLQHDRTLAFDAVDWLARAARVVAIAVREARFDRSRLRGAADEGHMNATDLADFLVGEGVPFRTAYLRAAEAVRVARRRGVPVDRLDLARLLLLSQERAKEAARHLRLEEVVARRSVRGGTSASSVAKQIEEFEKGLSGQKRSLSDLERRIERGDKLLQGRG